MRESVGVRVRVRESVRVAGSNHGIVKRNVGDVSPHAQPAVVGVKVRERARVKVRVREWERAKGRCLPPCRTWG